MNVSVIIVNYNVKEYIISCIHSIYKHTKSNLKFEIIVVDNNSKDGSVKKIIDEFPEITVIRNNINAGYSTAVNQAANQCIGRYIFILNPDTLFVEDILNKLCKILDQRPSIGAIGPRLLSSDKSIQQSTWRKPNLINTVLSLMHLEKINFKKNYGFKDFKKLTKVETISGAAIFTPKSVFDKLNGLNDSLFWMEDIDFSVRLNNLGYDVFYSPLTKIIHFSGKSSKKNYEITILNQYKSKVKFFKIHHSKFDLYTILIIIFLVLAFKLMVSLIMSPLLPSFRKKVRAYFYTLKSLLKMNNSINF